MAFSDVQGYDRMKELKAFDATQAGVKGLLDAGLVKIPEIFVRPSDDLKQDLPVSVARVQVPVIDLDGIDEADRRKQIVEEVKRSAETWGFFQVVNHGIPLAILDGMIEGVSLFNEQDLEEKKRWYTRDRKRTVRYHSNYDLFTSRSANWRDTLAISFTESGEIDPKELPDTCRDSSVEYSKYVLNLGNVLFGILSEALGLEKEYLEKMECSKGHRLTSHYYPACPQPELTLGTTMHSDPGFLTVLLQNQISGLQVIYQDHWVDVHPVSGGLVINIGDLLQLISNARFRSNKHRVVASRIGPRISVACFFSGPIDISKIYGPIKELVSEENPRIYKDVMLRDYMTRFLATGLDVHLGLDYYKV